MANIFTETWNETVEDVKRVMPEHIKEQLTRNKYKYIAIVAFIFILEISFGSVIWNYFTKDDNATTISTPIHSQDANKAIK